MLVNLADRLQTTVVLFCGRPRALRQTGYVSRNTPEPPLPDVRILLWPGSVTPPVAVVEGDSGPWTVVRVPNATEATVLAVYGDRSDAMDDIGMTVGVLTRILERGAHAHTTACLLATHALARRLARVHGFPLMCELVASVAGRLLGAHVASVAIFDPVKQVLRVEATYGYPKPLVEHARIRPGQGIIGTVFDAGVALCVSDVRTHASGWRRRARYRTNSFVAVPVHVGRQALGVISVTDAEDDHAFTHADLSMLRALTAPFALALSRELAIGEAEQYALAAAIDPLSGLFNRRHLYVRLEEELERARRHEIPLGLLMIDLDDFKVINDRFGHLAGDVVIKEVATILRRSVRMFDVCTRYGGEEFAILMPNSNAQSAAKVAERIRSGIEACRFTDSPLTSLAITASIGVAVSSTQLPPGALIEQADRALYQAKTLGKNRVCGD